MTPRRNDPWTSYAARLGIKNVHPSQAAVLCVLEREQEAMTLEQIVAAVQNTSSHEGWPRFSDSRIRTAVKELIEATPPLVYDTGHTTKSWRGNPARLLQRVTRPDLRSML